ncbi:ribosome biogenesis GTPase Der [Peptococcus niger]|uniref:GTPase Der n=1 Tax=Peptococcus niger TaxID=2741 RepID=A0A1G6SDW9_PEPNI|nr:ribosome biogenesis GTPase Der [Peptococcus niger]SDD15088.1 GTP-binding protein [Peptococcus niger]
MKPIIAIVGRPNVGKSTLFNRLTQTRKAIIEDVAGVTRDRLYEDGEWNGRQFTLIDTGGIDTVDKDHILKNVRLQAEIAIEESDLILFMVDASVGVTQEDETVAQILRKSDKTVILVANKVKDFEDLMPVYEFYSLGFEHLVPIAAVGGRNTGDLLDLMVSLLPDAPPVTAGVDASSIAVVGRPNVGKSSLCNRLLGEERSIVSDVPGTTRDAIDTPFRYNGENYILVDTAGMRRRKKVELATEKYSVVRSLHAVDRSDVVLMVIDGSQGLTDQDKRIVGYAHEQGKGIVLVVNKWDLVEKDHKTQKEMEDKFKGELLFLAYAPMIFVSAVTGQRVGQIMETVHAVVENRLMRVPTGVLNDIIREAVLKNPPPTDKGKRLKIYYATQIGVAPPTFALFVNDQEIMHFSYLRYLENRIRDYFVFEGTTLRLQLRNRKED